MVEKNGADLDQENAALEAENLQDEELASDEQAPDADASEEPAADSGAPEEDSSPGDAENMADESNPDEEQSDDSAGSDLLSQEDIDNAIEQEGAEASEEGAVASEDSMDGGGDEEMSQEEIDAAINAAVGELDADDFTMNDQQPDVKEADFQQLSSSNKDAGQRNIDLLMDVELPVSIELGKTKMDISDILALGPGSVVELEKLVGEPVDLLVNNKCVARGEVVVVEENFGLRITQLISPEERIKNLQ